MSMNMQNGFMIKLVCTEQGHPLTLEITGGGQGPQEQAVNVMAVFRSLLLSGEGIAKDLAKKHKGCKEKDCSNELFFLEFLALMKKNGKQKFKMVEDH